MKRLATSFVITAVLALAMPLAAAAQTRYYDRNTRSYYTRSYSNQRYSQRRYNPNRRSFYQRHRTAVNTGAGAGAGALIGAIVGGKKGAIIGALAGAGGGFVYSKVKKPKRTYYRRY
jgi:hypothetical protein